MPPASYLSQVEAASGQIGRGSQEHPDTIMQRSFVIAGAIALAVSLYVASGFVFPHRDQAANAAPEPGIDADAGALVADEPAAPLPRVGVIDSVARERQRAIVLRGRSEADRTVTISAQTTGQVEEVMAEKGARVSAGTPIARLDDADRRVKLVEATALLAQREEEWKATSELSAKGYSPKLSLPDLEAKLALARSAVAAMQVEIAYLKIAAPIEGVLNERDVEIGKYLQPGDPVATIVDLDPILLIGSVAEREVPHIILGAPATARLIDGQEVTGHVRFVAASADEATRTFRVEIAADNADYRIRQGLSAEIVLPIASEPAHLISPASLTLDENGQVGVKTVDTENTVGFLPVQVIGEDSEGLWIAGLPPQLRIITVGQEFVKVGQVVTPVPVQP